MPGTRLFLDTYYIQALLNPRDPHHERALALLPQVRRAAEVVITEAILLELYESRVDEEWGLTDCISFVVMRDRDLVEAATGDRHFQQADFTP